MNAFKKYARVAKRGISFEKLLSEKSNLTSETKTSEDPMYTLIQVILSLSTDTIKDNFYHLGGKIGEFSDQNKRMTTAEIVWKWGRSIVGSGAYFF